MNFEVFQTLSQNASFFNSAYSMNGMMAGFGVLLLVDTALKGWAMWRAARMQKQWWFVALLLVNSVGIFPGIFLLTTNAKYQEFVREKGIRP